MEAAEMQRQNEVIRSTTGTGTDL